MMLYTIWCTYHVRFHEKTPYRAPRAFGIAGLGWAWPLPLFALIAPWCWGVQCGHHNAFPNFFPPVPACSHYCTWSVVPCMGSSRSCNLTSQSTGPTAIYAGLRPVIFNVRPHSMRRAYFATGTFASCLLAGCCAFVPCHPGTWVVGVVTESNGQVVAGSSVSLYGSRSEVGSGGCFREHRSSAKPLTLSVSAPGFKPVADPARFGFYRLSVTLVRESEAGASKVTWESITEQEFAATKPCS